MELKFTSVSFLIVLATSCGNGGSSGAQAISLQTEGRSSLKIHTNFDPSTGSYSGILETESKLRCVDKSYKGFSGFDSKTMEIDEFAPIFEDAIVVNIIPDENNVPLNYSFSSRISDTGCGAPKLKAVCLFWNETANLERHNGATNDEVGIPQPYIWAASQDCMVNNAQSTNSYSEFMYHVIDYARPNDKLTLDVYLVDGAGNQSSTLSVSFYKFETLQRPYITSSSLK